LIEVVGFNSILGTYETWRESLIISLYSPLTGGAVLGFTYVKVKMVNPTSPERSETVELIVDTGAVYTIVPKDILETLKIDRRGSRVFQTVNKQKIKRDIGVAVVEYLDAVAGTNVIFGEEDDIPVLGVTTLEELGLEVDPISKQLKPTVLYLL
jgi:clan AA aspartic protease